MADRATARHVQVDIDSGMPIASSTIIDWLPVIIEFSILDLVIGIVKKIGRWQ